MMSRRIGKATTIKVPAIDKENLNRDKKANVTQKTEVTVKRPVFQQIKTNCNEATGSVKNKEKVVKSPEKIKSPTRPKDVIDIDTSEDPQLVPEYAKDIYEYLLTLENKYTINEGFLTSHVSTPKMRSILIDWLVEVQVEFKFTLETLHMTVAIIDRYLDKNKTVGKSTLQLVGVTAMFIACKYEEIYVPAISNLVDICDKSFKKQQILQTEIDILKTLEFNLSRPLSLHFLRRYSKATQADCEEYVLAKYILELALIDHQFSHINPSIQAAAAICLSLSIKKGLADPQQAWSKTLTYYSGYKYTDIKVTIVKLACIIGRIETSKYQSVPTKYAATRYYKISLSKNLKCNLIRKLIANSLTLTKK